MGGLVGHAVLDVAGDVLDDHDGVVGDETDGRRDPPQSHQVDRLAADSEAEKDDRDGDGNRGHGDRRNPGVAEIEKQDDRRERDADQDRIAYSVD